MPPKGSKGRTPRPGSSNEGSGDPKITSPTIPKADATPDPSKGNEVNSNHDSDSSELNEEDSFKILTKIKFCLIKRLQKKSLTNDLISSRNQLKIPRKSLITIKKPTTKPLLRSSQFSLHDLLV